MALKLPTSLGSPSIPQPGSARRVASLDSGGLASDLIRGSQIQGTAFHRTAVGMQDLGQAYDKLQLQSDQKEAKDWLNQLIKSKTDLMYGDGTDTNPGYMNMQGDTAVKSAKATSEQLDKMRTDFLGKASNKQVAKMFDLSSTELITPDHEDILKHASKEHLVALDTTDNATVAAAYDLLAANPTDPRTEQNATALIMGSINAKLDRAGITDKTARGQALIEGVSGAKAAAVQAALVRDPKAGAALYAKWKDQIQGSDQAKLEQSIVQAEDREMRKQEHQMYLAEHQANLYKSQEEDRLADKYLKHTLTIDDIYNSGADGSAKITMANALLTRDKEGQQIRGNADMFIDAFKRIGLPANDPNAITSRTQYIGLMGRDGLNDEQISKLDTEFTKAHKEGDDQLKSLKDQWLKAARQELSGENELLGLKDPKGQRAMGSALSWMISTYDKLHKKGLSDLEIFDPNSPRSESMYNGIKQFKRAPAEYMKDLYEANPGNASASVAQAEGELTFKDLPSLQQGVKDGKIDKAKAKALAIKNGWAQ